MKSRVFPLRRTLSRRRRPYRRNCLILLLLFPIYLLTRRNGPSQMQVSSRFPQHIAPSRTRNIPSVEIFSAPKPFTSEDASASIAAINSWKALTPRPRITLVGKGSSYQKAAKDLRVAWTDAVDTTFLGVPNFHSLVALANRSSADVAVIINADIHLFGDFMQSLRKVYGTFQDFLVIGARFDVHEIPDDLPDNSEDRATEIRKYVMENGVLHTQGGMDFWAWNTRGPRLYDNAMPPFIFGRGKYDNWFTHETVAAGRRQVVDVSETCMSVHIKHDYRVGKMQSEESEESEENDVTQDRHDVSNVEKSTSDGDESEFSSNTTRKVKVNGNSVDGPFLLGDDDDSVPNEAMPVPVIRMASHRRRLTSFWSYGKLSKFELFTNIYLSLRTGTYANGMGTTRHAPWKLAGCYEPSGMCLIRRQRPGICYCEYSTAVGRAQLDPRLTKKGLPKHRCVEQSVEMKDVYSLPISLPEGKTHPEHFGLPLTASDAIEKVVINNTIIISALNYGYRSIMMNWVCNMRRLGITNFVIAALDPELYLYAYTKGIATYYEDTFEKGVADKDMRRDGVYGSVLFKRLTKMKTRVVSRVLKLGYNVVWSDTDIIFFKNPIQYLWAQNADLVIQSNAPDKEKANGPRRINSGFYLAQSNADMIKALDEVINRALKSRKSEQPSFYDVLCGVDSEHTVGDDMCSYNGVVVKLLDRSKFPNGGTKGIWDSKAGSIPHRFPGLYILHNNWVVGVDGKEERLHRHGFMMFDSEEEMCRYGPFPLYDKS